MRTPSASRRGGRPLAVALGSLALAGATVACTSGAPGAGRVAGAADQPVSAQADPAGCAPIEVIAARGTGEPRGMSLMGGLNSAVARQTGGVVYNVNYPASVDYLNGPQQGAADTIRRLNQRSSQCPNMKFVLTGYSEGAMVMTVALGKIPANIAPKIVGGVLWGNPYYKSNSPASAGPARGANGLIPMIGIPAQYAPKFKDFCNVGDPVCGAGANVMAHLAYGTSAGSQQQAIAWAVSKVKEAH